LEACRVPAEPLETRLTNGCRSTGAVKFEYHAFYYFRTRNT
jgi:hypothetical protein